MSESQMGIHWEYDEEGSSRVMERFVGPAFV